MTFLQRLLPQEGLICVAQLLPQGGFRHFFCEDLAEAEQQIKVLERSEQTVFVAQATFKTNASRKQDNALYLKNFFMDIDCGPEKDYPTQQEAVAALKKFVADTEIPFPSVVVSGNGLYAHWVMEEMVPAEQWKTTARILKHTAAAYGFKTDPMRTADSASVLRPVGATHRKDPNNPKSVRLALDSGDTPFLDFVKVLQKAAKKKSVDITPIQPPKVNKDINAEFYEGTGPASIPSYIEQVATKCSQIRNYRTQKGDVSEPYWYAALGVMVFCEDGESFIQEWSSGHPGYSEASTSAKAQQYLDSGTGPTTCAHFGTINPETCIGCPHNGKIKSPIVLGRPEPEAIAAELADEVPQGFRRTETGLYYEEEGRWFRFYDQDLRIDRIAFDETLGYQVAVIKHCLPHEGCMEFPIRSSLVHDARALMTMLSDNHVHVVGNKEKKVMVAYVESYIARLQRSRRMTHLLNQMGWKIDNQGRNLFVLGKKIIHEDGTIEEASLARHVPSAASGFKTEGDPNKWVQATKILDQPGMEPFAFALLCGFGAPLMKFTGFDGSMISMVGDSGIGKTLLLRWVLSIYGYHNNLMMLRDDTRNALVSRLGVYGNLPLVVDEITNIDGMELSDLVYRVTQGRDKVRLTKNSEERKCVNGWNTLALVSTNSSLIDKLSGSKHDASAEINRVFEYATPKIDAFSGKVTSDVYWTIDNNYGHVGEKYLQWLCQNIKRIKTDLGVVQTKIDEASKIQGDERFWSATAATAIYGGVVAKKLGLIDFDVNRVMAWAAEQIRGMRSDKADLAGDAVGILGQFLDEHAGHRLIVKGDATGGRQCNVIEAPRGPLVIRHELDEDRLYFSRNVFKTWLGRKFGSYSKVRKELEQIGALKNANKNKTLGGGTTFSGASTPCWEVDLKCRKLGNVGLQLVHNAGLKAKGAAQ